MNMATRPNKEFYSLLKLKKCMARINEDIRFLKLCLKHEVTPKSHQVRINSTLPGALGNKRRIEKDLIKGSINNCYMKLSDVSLRTYSAHLELTKSSSQHVNIDDALEKIHTAYICEKIRKRKTLTRKINRLRSKKPVSSDKKQPEVEEINEFVVNRSTQTYTIEQLKLLNRGLNFAIKRPEVMLQEVIADVEAGVRFNAEAEKRAIREQMGMIIKRCHSTADTRRTKECQLVKELNAKPAYYIKADKGNNIVIMDMDDYDNLVTNKIKEGNYRELRTNPLPDLIKRIDRTLRECGAILGENARSLKVPNPCLPRMKCLPKIHKPGNEMREIITGTHSPTHRIARWLLEEFSSMGQWASAHSVKNYMEVINRLTRAGGINDDEVMVSFDIKALFPSIPVHTAMSLLEDWLMEKEDNVNWKHKVKQYIRLAKLCMFENSFTFRGRYFKSTKGVAMGNRLSGLVSEVFLTKMEKDLDEKGVMPRVWMRYVDDIFVIIDRDEVEETLRTLNLYHKDIKFTMEIEEEGRIPFLDLLIKRQEGSLAFEVHRKATHTQRVIPRDSNHHAQHKMSAFNSMIHRLINIPMSKEDFDKERNYIIETGRKNGYHEELIAGRIRKIVAKKNRDLLTTFHQQKRKPGPEQKEKRTAVTYDSRMTKRIRAAFSDIGMEAVPTSRAFQLKNLLRSTKDGKGIDETGGIYKISCPQCEKIYIGQTRRTIATRFQEHINEARIRKEGKKSGGDIKSSVAKHMLETDHAISEDNVTIVKIMDNPHKLDFYEMLTIRQENQTALLNENSGWGDTPLFSFLDL